MMRALCSAAVALAALSAACADPAGPSPLDCETVTAAELPRVDPHETVITTSVATFMGLLPRVRPDAEVLVWVRGEGQPVLDRQALLDDPDAEGWHMLLPEPGDSLGTRMFYGQPTWTRAELEGVAEFLSAGGAEVIDVGTALPYIHAELPLDLPAQCRLLKDLMEHPNLDYVGPNRLQG